MDSTVRLRDLDSGELETHTLVFADQANIANNRLSILAPIGFGTAAIHVSEYSSTTTPTDEPQMDYLIECSAFH